MRAWFEATLIMLGTGACFFGVIGVVAGVEYLVMRKRK